LASDFLILSASFLSRTVCQCRLFAIYISPYNNDCSVYVDRNFGTIFELEPMASCLLIKIALAGDNFKSIITVIIRGSKARLYYNKYVKNP
jgi:hypothetical protein